MWASITKGVTVGWGLFLIALGIVLMMEQERLILDGFWHHGWPWL
jgi:hypothetical protein